MFNIMRMIIFFAYDTVWTDDDDILPPAPEPFLESDGTLEAEGEGNDNYFESGTIILTFV